MIFISLLLKLDAAHDIWDQCDISSALNGDTYKPLVLCAVTADTPRYDLAALGYKVFKPSGIFIVDRGGVLKAETAYLLSLICPLFALKPAASRSRPSS
jgi:hypothetical protein